MRARRARRLAAARWVRRNRPPVGTCLPAAVERHILDPLSDRDGDMSSCPHRRGRGVCDGQGSCWSSGEPICDTMVPARGWPRERIARGMWW